MEEKTMHAPAPATEVFRVNYYLGAMLAQGGNLTLEEAVVKFSPTSALDRAMGAKDVEIPYKAIRGMSYSGPLSRSFTIKTEGKVHKFEGAQAKRVWELLAKTLPEKGCVLTPMVEKAPARPPVSVADGLACDGCRMALQPGYAFCPSCGTSVKSVCGACKRSIDPRWAACAFCGVCFNTGATDLPRAA
jgi:hypothetical protein